MKKFIYPVTRLILLVTIVTFGSAKVYAQGKFSGYMFGDYFYNVAHDSMNTTLKNAAIPGAPKGIPPKGYQAFQFRRIYFAYDNEISDQFSTRFRLEADQAANASNGKIGVFVKDAYLKWKNIFAGSDFYFGIQPTSVIDISEVFGGYRSLEKTIIDLRGIVPSRDFGVTLRGKLMESGMLNYWVMIANGSANSPETDKYKRYYFNLLVKPMDKIQISVYTDYLANADITDKYSASPKRSVSNGTLTYAAFVGYKEPDQYNIGLEVFNASKAHGYDNKKELASLDAVGYSVFGSFNLTPETAVVARYDHYDPNTAPSSNGDYRNYILAGLAWKPNKNVSIMPNIQLESYESLPVSVSLPNGRSIDSSLVGRVTLYYVFL